jgi:hypothetical protein
VQQQHQPASSNFLAPAAAARSVVVRPPRQTRALHTHRRRRARSSKPPPDAALPPRRRHGHVPIRPLPRLPALSRSFVTPSRPIRPHTPSRFAKNTTLSPFAMDPNERRAATVPAGWGSAPAPPRNERKDKLNRKHEPRRALQARCDAIAPPCIVDRSIEL